jgi:chromosome segregation ATPase
MPLPDLIAQNPLESISVADLAQWFLGATALIATVWGRGEQLFKRGKALYDAAIARFELRDKEQDSRMDAIQQEIKSLRDVAHERQQQSLRELNQAREIALKASETVTRMKQALEAVQFLAQSAQRDIATLNSKEDRFDKLASQVRALQDSTKSAREDMAIDRRTLEQIHSRLDAIARQLEIRTNEHQ